jgi:two-component sensor histidine kinase
VLLATLLSGWRAGLITLGIFATGAWYLVVPPHQAFFPLAPAAARDLAFNIASLGMVLVIAQLFRVMVRKAGADRAAAIESYDLHLRELDHRMKNNFQMVAGLLEMQRRIVGDPAVEEALQSVIIRVRNLAQAHSALHAPSGEAAAIDFGRYVADLCGSLAESLLLTTLVRVRCDCESAPMPSDRAVALGVVINELVTNAAKHAFPNGRSGEITVTFKRRDDGWRLTVEDDGVGAPPRAKKPSGIGLRLVDAFARQAGGTLSQSQGKGTTFVVDLPG